MQRTLKNLFARKAPKSLSGKRRPLVLETLAERALPAASITASLDTADGILKVEGTYGDDRIDIRYSLGKVRVDGTTIAVTDNGTTSNVAYVPRAQVTKVVVAALDGDDRVEMHDVAGSNGVPIPVDHPRQCRQRHVDRRLGKRHDLWRKRRRLDPGGRR